jgi:hypothetical protein
MPNRIKLDPNVPAGWFDFLTEVDPDVTADPVADVLKDCAAAGAMRMSSDVAHRHLAALEEECQSQTYRQKFAKRFDVTVNSNSPADSILQKANKNSSPSDDEWRTLIARSSRMIREGTTIKLFNSADELIGEREVNG